MLALKRRAIAAFEALGVLMTDTCINYQTIMPAVRGEHMAYGDTGVVIYSNSVFGRAVEFRGRAVRACRRPDRPHAALWLSPDEWRRADALLRIEHTPRDLHEWGALGGIVGRIAGDYWEVPAAARASTAFPRSDELKHFGAALASYGSVALFHMLGVTPEAEDAVDPSLRGDGEDHRGRDLRAFPGCLSARIGDTVDVVVFSSPQLSRCELRDLADVLDGRRVHPIPLLVVTSPQIKPDADRFGHHRAHRGGGRPRRCRACASTRAMRARWPRRMAGRRLLTTSAKLVNIHRRLWLSARLWLSMRECVDAACSGRIVVMRIPRRRRDGSAVCAAPALVAKDGFSRAL